MYVMDTEFPRHLQAQAFEILSSNDSSPMEAILSHLFSAEEPQRSRATTLFDYCKKHYPVLFFMKLTYLLGYSPRYDTRVSASRLVDVRQLWPVLPLKAQLNLKVLFLDCLRQEKSMPNVKVICGVVAVLVSVIYEAGDEWPEFLEFLVNCALGDSERLQEISLLVFIYFPKACRKIVGEALLPRRFSLYTAFSRKLYSNNVDLRVTCIAAIVSQIHLFVGYSCRNILLDLLNGVMKTLSELLNQSKDDHVQKVLNELVALVEEPDLLKPFLNGIAGVIIDIIESKTAKFETRNAAVNFLMRLVEPLELKPMIQTFPSDTTQRMFAVSIRMLLFIPFQNGCYDMENQAEQNPESMAVYMSGIEFLERVSVALGGKITIPIAFEFLRHLQINQLWKVRHAGVAVLTVVSKEYSDDIVIGANYLEQALGYIFKCFQDPHPQVRWAAFNFMQQQIDFVSVMQLCYHHKILPALIAALDENQYPVIMEQAALAMLLFIQNTHPECLATYTNLNGLLSKLLALLQSSDTTPNCRRILLQTYTFVADQCKAALMPSSSPGTM